MFSLKPGTGRGPKLWCGNVTVDNTNTIDTGLGAIDAVTHSPTTSITSLSVSGGVITFTTGGSAAHYLLVVGRSL